MLYSVVFKCRCNVKSTFCEGDIYKEGEIEYFHIFLTANSFYSAMDRAYDYSLDNFSDFDVSIVSIQLIDELED